ncbi:MAG: glycoside hydrolase family 9 protein, partial [Lentisphaeraceae bacterium]|nr:glycoside hydrolase family 9 protein [Lentisphaeraceae bacterium]
KPYSWPLTERDFSPWLYFDLVDNPIFDNLEEYVPSTMKEKIKSWFIGKADEYAALNTEMPYRQSWPKHQDYWMSWGASDMTNRARALIIANRLEPKSIYDESIRNNINYMFGANPLGMSWTTGIGFCYPVSIQHESSQLDEVLDPYPGITIYGNTDGLGFYEMNKRILTSTDASGDVFTFHEFPANYPLFRRWFAHPTLNVGQCEFTVHETNSSTIFALGYLLSEGWLPSKALKERKPKSAEYLFGHWYLP